MLQQFNDKNDLTDTIWFQKTITYWSPKCAICVYD